MHRFEASKIIAVVLFVLKEEKEKETNNTKIRNDAGE